MLTIQHQAQQLRAMLVPYTESNGSSGKSNVAMVQYAGTGKRTLAVSCFVTKCRLTEILGR